jgi:hypothetical protein
VQRADEEIDARSLEQFAACDLILALVFLSPEAGRPPLALSPAEFSVGSSGNTAVTPT